METWCLVIDWIGNEFADVVVRTVQEECRLHGRSLLVFTLGSLSYHLDEATLAAHVLPILGARRIDRILFSAGQLVRGGGGAKMVSVLKRLAPRPSLTLGGEIGGVAACRVSHDRAFLSLLDHLWDHHGYRRFAWVGGPVDNPVARHRRVLFLGFLADRGAALSPDHDIDGDFNLSAGREAGVLLAGRTQEFDVVVAANDSMAVGLREFLGPAVPVTGFDNHRSSRAAGLTTVDTEAERETRAGVARLADLTLDPRPEPEPLELGRVVVRSSCGCPAGPAEPSPAETPSGPLSGQRGGHLFAAILEAEDLSELARRLNMALPSEAIRFWKILATYERGSEGDTDLWPEGHDEPLAIVVHSLFREEDFYGYLMHDLDQGNYALSEWLRINLSLTLRGWHQRSGNLHVQKLLQVEIDRFTRRQRDVEAVLNSLPVWIVELDRRLQLRYGNQAWKTLVGWSGGRATGAFLQTVAPKDQERVENRLLSALRGSHVAAVDFQFQATSGRKVAALGEIQPLSEEEGAPLAALFGSLHGGTGLRLVGLDLHPLIDGVLQPEDLMFKHYDFSPREQEAIRWLALGLDSEELADAMDVSPSTVRVVLHHVYTKTGVNRRREFLELMADYNARAQQGQSLTQVLLSRILRP